MGRGEGRSLRPCSKFHTVLFCSADSALHSHLLLSAGDDAERRLDDQVGTLLDCLLGGEPEGLPGALEAAAVAAAGASTAPAVALAAEGGAPPPPLLPPPGDSSLCQICMDRDVRVEVAGCGHELCYQCARRLCTTPDHSLPQCPFCRQSISGWACKHAA